jgi:hypothetical protein
MRRRFITALTATALAAGGAAAAERVKPIPAAFGLDLAGQATPEGAKAIEAAYALYLPQAVIEKGVLSVAPDGADYVVSWNFEKALADGGNLSQVLKVAPFVYRVTPMAGGGWIAKSSSLPKVTIQPADANDRQGGFVAFDGFALETRYDPEAKDFVNGKLGLGSVKIDLKSRSGDALQHVLATQNRIGGDLTVTAGEAPDSLDLRTNETIDATKQQTTVVGDDNHETPLSQMRQGATAGNGQLTGLRGKAMAELWRYAIAQIDSEAPADPQALKPKLEALLPLWKRVSGRAGIDDVAFAFPGGGVAIKSFGEEVDMTGLADKSSVDLFLAAKGVSLDLDAAPDWLKAVWPASLQFDLKAGVDGLDRAARLALDDPEFVKTGNLSEPTQDTIRDLLLGGHPHVALTKTQLSSPLVEATFEGEAEFAAGAPKAHGKATADDLDKLLALLAKIAESDPNARNALLGVTFVKGLARQEGGKLVWDLEYVGPKSVRVNGQLLGDAAP